MIRQPIWLASRSPRRRLLLEQAGIQVRVRVAEIDDGRLAPGPIAPEHWVAGMARLKAADVVRQLSGGAKPESGLVLAADTVCVQRGMILGQPVDGEHARSMLLTMRNATHRTISGVCLWPIGADPTLFVDSSIVHIGALTDAQVDAYVASNAWRGKAGGYNLVERIDAGWPVRCEGDPATVMGLPMRRLTPMLNGVGATPTEQEP